MEKLKVNLAPIAEKLMGRNRSQLQIAAPPVFIAPIIGALIGAGTALLLAPQSGKRTQALLQRQGKQLKRQAGRTVEDLRTNIEDTANELQARVNDLQQNSQSILANGTGVVQNTLSSAKRFLSPVQQTPLRHLLIAAAPLLVGLAAVNVLRARGG